MAVEFVRAFVRCYELQHFIDIIEWVTIGINGMGTERCQLRGTVAKRAVV